MKPRQHVHRGVVEAVAILIDPATCGEAGARSRVLALWSAGTRVDAVEGRYLVRRPTPLRVRAEFQRDTPLTAVDVSVDGRRVGSALTAAPLLPRELAALDPDDGAIILVAAGVVSVARSGSLTPIDPSIWLAVDAFRRVVVAPLGDPPPRPRTVAAETTIDPRTDLAGLPSPTTELTTLLRSLESGAGSASETPSGSSRLRTVLTAPLRLVAGVVTAATALAAALLGAVASRGRGPHRGAKGGQIVAADDAPRRPTRPRGSGRLGRLLDRLLLTTRLSSLLGRRNAKVVDETLRRFDRGDLDGALRNAIPLAKAGALSEPGSSWRTFFARRHERDQLSPQLARPQGSGGFMWPDLYDALRHRYRHAYERLVAGGEIEKAAFVLADLLGEVPEAVSLLETHGQFELAARLAESRELAPGLVVRQWMLAGDKERAARIARRTGAFADAVHRLEPNHKSLAALLRLTWGESLAAAGDYELAADVARPIEAARGLVRRWMQCALDAGGASGARVLAQMAQLAEGDDPAIRDRVSALLADDDPAQVRSRAAFAATLGRGGATPLTRALARTTARTLVRDLAAGRPHVNRKSLLDVVALTDDGALRSDVRPLRFPAARPLVERDLPVAVIAAASDVGTTAAHDAVLLGDGRMLVALGELGVRLLRRDGSTAATIDAPAERLVIDDHDTHAVALARRGDLWRITRVDLVTRTARQWVDARLDVFAADHDGSSWLVAIEDELLAIDLQSSRFEALWHVGDIGQPVQAIARSATRATVAIGGAAPQLWSYELPGFTLRERHDRAVDDPSAVILSTVVSAGGVWMDLYSSDDDGTRAVIGRRQSTTVSSASLPGQIVWALAADDEWAAVVSIAADATLIRALDQGRRVARLAIALAGAEFTHARLRHGYLTTADDRGRVLAIDMTNGSVVRDLRV